MKKIRLGLVVSEFNYDITMMMLERAREHAKFLGAEIAHVLKSPGAFDIPLLAKKLIERDDIDAVVTIGAVIEGETGHDEIVMQNAARKIEDLSVEYGKPVTLGISGPGESRLQAEVRIEKARDAVEAAVKLVKRIREIES